MSPVVIILIVGALLVVIGPKLFAPSIEKEVQRAAKSGDLTALINLILNLRASAQADAFNTAIRRLWDSYEREKAAALVKELAERFPDERIAQYWLDQVQKVEPDIAKRMLEADFVAQYYRPEVAARCGSFG
jgi:catalase